jgi:hypothetical protein
MGYDATALGAYMGVHLTIQLFMLVMQGPYVFSGKDEDLDLLLLKAESLARSRWCYLTELDEEGAEIYWWKYSDFFNEGLWRERTPICTPANYKAMSEEAYDCIVSCLGSSSASKILKGVPKGGGAKLMKKLHAAKGSVEHQIQRWDSKLERLTLATNGLNRQMVGIILMNLRRMISLLKKSSLESSTGNWVIFFLLFFKHVFMTLLLVVVIV